jgi:hypothetical protein
MVVFCLDAMQAFCAHLASCITIIFAILHLHCWAFCTRETAFTVYEGS